MADTRDIEASRPEFEAQMRAAGYRDDRHDTGEYVGVTSYRWEGWIAAHASRPRLKLDPALKAALEEAATTGATSTMLPGGEAVFINRGHDYGDNAHLECTACGGSGHIDDQRQIALASRPAEVEERLQAVDAAGAQLADAQQRRAERCERLGITEVSDEGLPPLPAPAQLDGSQGEEGSAECRRAT